MSYQVSVPLNVHGPDDSDAARFTTVAAENVFLMSQTPFTALFLGEDRTVVSSVVTSVELEYLGGVTSGIQAQLDGKAPLSGGDTLAANNATLGNALTLNALTGSRVLVTNADKTVASSVVTTTELGYLGGVTSGIQAQLDGKAPLGGGGGTDPLVVVNPLGLAQEAGLFIQRSAGSANVVLGVRPEPWGGMTMYKTDGAIGEEGYDGLLWLTVGDLHANSVVITDSTRASNYSFRHDAYDNLNVGYYGVGPAGFGDYTVASMGLGGSTFGNLAATNVTATAQVSAQRVHVAGGPQQWIGATSFVTTSATNTLNWTDLDPDDVHIHLAGTLHVSVTNGSEVSPRVGHATVSLVWCRTNRAFPGDTPAYVELNVVQVSSSKTSALTTFTVGKAVANDHIVVNTDAGCLLSWQFFGTTL